MNSNCKSIVVRPSILGYLFGAKKAVIYAGTKEIKIRHKGKEITLPYEHLIDDLRYEKGFLFHKIVLDNSNKEHIIGWLKQPMITTVRHFCKIEFYRFLSIPVLSLSKKIKSQLVKQYPRSVYWEKIQKDCLFWQKNYCYLPPKGILSDENFLAFRYIDEIARGVQTNLRLVQDRYVSQQLRKHEKYFDTVESNPLTRLQRQACIIDEENNLVLAGAGSGKTSVMIGRAGFLLKSQQAHADEILMLAFAKKAADEMSERITEKLGIENIKASTFHSLGQYIIANAEGVKPSVSVLATDTKAYDKFINSQFDKLLENPEYKNIVVDHFLYFRFEPINPFEYSSVGDYNQTIRDNDFRTNQGEQVKGYQELLIANFLYRNGINYQYEAKYKYDTRTLEFRQYQPDFYLTDYGIYIEHYGIDRNGNTAPYIDAQKYNEGIAWKRNLHKENNTICIETFHYEWLEDELLGRLEEKLHAHNVVLNPVSNDEFIRQLQDSEQLSELSVLLGKMLKLFKASNLDESIFQQAEQQMSPSTTLQKIFDTVLSTLSKYHRNNNNLARLKSAQKLLIPLYENYQLHLIENQDIDFDDMINKAIQYVKDGDFVPPWKYIMVDEFQDISSSRATLITELRNKTKDCSIFCVGDDWQAIYRFTGSDLAYVTEFESKFGITKTTLLDKTFRFNNSISDISSTFVTQNPSQIKKDISTFHQVEKPAISILRADESDDDKKLENVEQVLNAIAKTNEESSVLILGRYTFNLPDRNKLISIEKRLGNIKIKAMTIHSSKGKEADFIILMGLQDGKFGFPSERKEHPLIDALLPKAQEYPFAEERRLFYVAMTRAKKRSYLIVDMKKPSRFIIELIQGEYPVELDEFAVSGSQLVYQQVHCVQCEIGHMLPRHGRYGDFYGCSCYPRCNHLENGCPECGSLMERTNSYKLCTDQHCNGWTALCPECGGELALRKGRYGDFWGCKNYRSQGISCGYTTKHVKPPAQLEEITYDLSNIIISNELNRELDDILC